ncbi:MAG: PAS domain-containing protein [Alphaproteobacteria bacterium]|nr:hypothetical protein [Rhodobiaceae bacterium]MBO6542063.1 PAS domain-containing protein [Alphaproteobacteria bacterium]MBO6628232.1 PAS domain-containing protein [Alphaproteobacteria bacterium]MDF1625080.1 PAS domain-containing protein [Parvibaculaceae bacterium]|tara:strand:- start:256 stop:837 length:582 start_codon:yes stop_codon:yes gene_type:complete
MTFDEISASSSAPLQFNAFIDCYRSAQQEDGIGVKSALPFRAFAPLMADITLLEFVDNQALPYRLAGENVLERMGRDVIGKDFLDYIPPALRLESLTAHRAMCSLPCGYYMIYENEYVSGQRVKAETMTLPLKKSTSGAANFFLSYHIHHKVTGVNLHEKNAALIVGYELSTFVDIGYGLPESATHEAAPARA